MDMGSSRQVDNVPLISLPPGTVLLPGLAQKLTIPSNRPDVAALLAVIYDRAASKYGQRLDAVPLACVPLCSPLLAPDGRLLLENGNDDQTATNNATPENNTLYSYGVAVKLQGVEGNGTGEFALLVEPVCRLRVDQLTQEQPYPEGRVTVLQDDDVSKDSEMSELFSLLQTRSREYLTILRVAALLNKPIPVPAFSALSARRIQAAVLRKEMKKGGTLADIMAMIIDSPYEERLQVLAAVDVKSRVIKVIDLLDRQITDFKNNLNVSSVTTIPIKIVPSLPDRSMPNGVELPSSRFKKMFSPSGNSLPPQPDSGEPSELDELQRRLEKAGLPSDSQRMVYRELHRLQKMAPANQEYQVIRNWLETLADIPWTITIRDRLDRETLARARKQLDDDHYGLEKVKKRLLEYLAVLRLKQSIQDDLEAKLAQHATTTPENPTKLLTEQGEPEPDQAKAQAKTRLAADVLRARKSLDKSPIMLLAGPPGTGKTSLAKSVATALGRKFHRIALGGVKDEAEIRGHRRTYVAAMPGIIVQSLRKVGVANPVILLDEIDKISSSTFNGDPSAAMLEVLDPEQNYSFTDHYVGIPVDLSKVLFIATANNLDAIPAPLYDRMETINLSGYTTLEKRHIALQHLVPKQIQANGLDQTQVVLEDDAVGRIIESYTRESGVRNLEREIGSVCRAKAVEYAEAKDSDKLATYRARVTPADVEQILGTERYEEEITEQANRPGVVTGLVAYSYGGDGGILFIEMADMPGNGGLQLTGQLGSVLQESVGVALSWVKTHAYQLGLTQDVSVDIMHNRSLHVHCPSGSIPKDGPSSGIAQAIAMISLFSSKAVPHTMAMTGEISLRGRVTAVGGIKEKLIGALRAGVKTVLLPSQNRKDLKDLPQEVKDGIEIIPVSHVWEAIQIVWPDWQLPNDHAMPGVESRL